MTRINEEKITRSILSRITTRPNTYIKLSARHCWESYLPTHLPTYISVGIYKPRQSSETFYSL